jgi:endonuclease YncB( thermonuclease family)
MRRAAPILVLGFVLGLGCSSPPPPPKDDLAMLARISALDLKIDEQERGRANLLPRIAALEAALGRRPRPDDDLVARIAAIESKLATLEDKVAFLEMARDVDRREEKPGTILDRKKTTADGSPAPAPGEVVRPLVAISGDTFSFVRKGKVDVARLAGVEAPGREDEGAATKARERLEELLTGGELRFEYPPGDRGEARGLTVYARVKKPDGSELIPNEVLLREGLVLAVALGEHPRKADFEKAQAEAKSAKRGIFSR